MSRTAKRDMLGVGEVGRKNRTCAVLKRCAGTAPSRESDVFYLEEGATKTLERRMTSISIGSQQTGTRVFRGELDGERRFLSFFVDDCIVPEVDQKRLCDFSFADPVEKSLRDDGSGGTARSYPNHRRGSNGDTTVSSEIDTCVGDNDNNLHDGDLCDDPRADTDQDDGAVTEMSSDCVPLLVSTQPALALMRDARKKRMSAVEETTGFSFLDACEPPMRHQPQQRSSFDADRAGSEHGLRPYLSLDNLFSAILPTSDMDISLNGHGASASSLRAYVTSERASQSKVSLFLPSGSVFSQRPELLDVYEGSGSKRESKSQPDDKELAAGGYPTISATEKASPSNNCPTAVWASYSADVDTDTFVSRMTQAETVAPAKHGDGVFAPGNAEATRVYPLHPSLSDFSGVPVCSLSSTVPMMFYPAGGFVHPLQQTPPPPQQPRQGGVCGESSFLSYPERFFNNVSVPNREQVGKTSYEEAIHVNTPSLPKNSIMFHGNDFSLPNPTACQADLSPISPHLQSNREVLTHEYLVTNPLRGALGSSGPFVTVDIDVVNTHDQEGAADKGGERSGEREAFGQPWLEVHVLLCLVFNLIKLHELHQKWRRNNASVASDNLCLSSSPDRCFAPMDSSMGYICLQLSHIFFEVEHVLLRPYFTQWSDAGLRNCVSDVLKAWKRKGPCSEEFESASFVLLNEVSAERNGRVKQTPLYHLWRFFGAPLRAPRLAAFVLLAVFIVIVSLVILLCPALLIVARVFLAAFSCILMICLGCITLLLLHHNAVSGKMRELCRLAMEHYVGIMHSCVREGGFDSTIPNTEQDSYYSFARRDVANSFEGTEGNEASTTGTTVAACLRSYGRFERDSQVLPTGTRGGWNTQHSHHVAVEGAHPQRDGACFSGDAAYHEENNKGWHFDDVRDKTILRQEEDSAMASNENLPQLDIASYKRPSLPRDGVMLERDYYDTLLMSSIGFEQQQLAEERMKSMIVRRSIASGLGDFSHVDMQDYLPFLDDLKGMTTSADETKTHLFFGSFNNASFSMVGSNAAVPRGGNSNGGTPLSFDAGSVAPLVYKNLRQSIWSGDFDALAITALVYCRSSAVREDVFSKLWSRNFLVLQRTTLEALDAAFHRGSERFKVFLLHAPDLDAGQLRIALSWLLHERRPVFFFASALDTMPPGIPPAFCLEVPLSARDVEAILLSGIGVDEGMNNVSMFRPSKQFRVPPYTLGRRLGGGTSSNVFEVKMEETGARCAVKRMFLRVDGEGGKKGAAKQLEEIAREMEIMSSLTHPNIVQYFFCGRDDNCVSIFMELCSGGSLSDVLARGGLHSAADIKDTLRDVIDAVVYLHGRSIVHCDLKPENVLFCDGRAKVSDFGTAMFKRCGSTHVRGTFAYMAPEVLLSETYDRACDVWSIGCIAAEALSIFLDHRDLGLLELCEKYRRMSLDEALGFDCDEPTVRSFLGLCLQRDPNKRCSAAQLLQHPMLQEADNAAVHRWMMTCAERREAQRLRRRRCLESIALSMDHVNSPVSLSATSLRSADISGIRHTPRQTPTHWTVS